MKKTFKDYIIQTEVLIENHEEIYTRLEKTIAVQSKNWNEIEAENAAKIVQDVFVDLNKAKIFLELLKADIPMRDDEEKYFELFAIAMASVYEDLNAKIPKFK